MAERLLYSIDDKVSGKLGSLASQVMVCALGVKTNLKPLERTLSLIGAVLLDAEERQAENSELRYVFFTVLMICLMLFSVKLFGSRC